MGTDYSAYLSVGYAFTLEELYRIAFGLAYVAVGFMSAAYATHRFEKHKQDCNLCGWSLLGVIWPLFLGWMLFFQKPYRILMGLHDLVLRRLDARQQRKELPEARLLKD